MYYSDITPPGALPPENQHPKKLVYVNKNFIQNKSRKILINPNFKQNVYINPHFNKSDPTTSSGNSIYVNPNLIKDKNVIYSTPSTSICKTTTSAETAGNTFKVRNDTNNIVGKGAVIKNTKMKLIRKALSAPDKENDCKEQVIVKRLSPRKEGHNFGVGSSHVIKNRFKIDKVNRKCKNSFNKNIWVSKYVKKRRLNSFSNQSFPVKKIRNRTEFVKINKQGKSERKFVNPCSNKRNGRKLITIRGQKYKLNANNKTLIIKKSTSSSLSKAEVKGLNSKPKKLYFKLKKLSLLSETKNYNSVIFRNKLKKCNISCPVFRKFGFCSKKEKGTCNRVHNPDQIMLCHKFLQGACIKDKCLLSHKVLPEKMPTCKFYLEGRCARENCQYLHIKINAKADICRKFLEGFCDKGRECDKRHQYLCPDFEKLGKCGKKRCPYPHGCVVRKSKVSNKIASKSSQKLLKKFSAEKINHDQNSDGNLKTRYYIESKSDNLENSSKSEGESSVPKKPKLGELPSFIPFTDS